MGPPIDCSGQGFTDTIGPSQVPPNAEARPPSYNVPAYNPFSQREVAMPTFITTMHFTEQGLKAVKDTCERATSFKATARKMGVKVTGMYRTLGAFDGVLV